MMGHWRPSWFNIVVLMAWVVLAACREIAGVNVSESCPSVAVPLIIPLAEEVAVGVAFLEPELGISRAPLCRELRLELLGG